MDKALVFGTKDCRLESCQDQIVLWCACCATGRCPSRPGPARKGGIAIKSPCLQPGAGSLPHPAVPDVAALAERLAANLVALTWSAGPVA